MMDQEKLHEMHDNFFKNPIKKDKLYVKQETDK